MKARLAHAKLNLFLRVVGRRGDGHHEIETLFQRVALADRLTFEALSGGLEVERRGPVRLDLVDPSENLVARAYEVLARRWPERIGGVRIVLDKRIPVAGGLGGGSSDAASALLALNEIFGLDLDRATLEAAALELGADVPFFLGPPTAVGRGVGEQLTPTPHASAFWAVLAVPEFAISTSEAYGRLDALASPDDAPSLGGLIQALADGDLEATLAGMFNALEPAAFAVQPALGRLRSELERRAGQPVRMTGSGSVLFTLADSEEAGRRIAAEWDAIPTLRTTLTRFVV